MTEKKIEEHVVQMAIQAIEWFYKKYEAKFDTRTIVALSIALSDLPQLRNSLELTPCEKNFRRIMITRPVSHSRDPGRIALIFGYDGLDTQKTDELNELINRFTKNKLIAE